ncbi:bifunctional phosphopantothenoylcysteine decarboxylase/phosphopantothenate--cysteine ligase CoaBC, partial [Shewanella sp. 0m-11]
DFFGPKLLQGMSLLLTAGPTREAIDPVRYISNHSSGKMGFALAKAAAQMGAEVTLVAGPVNLATPAGVTRINVESAQEMLDAVMPQVEQHQIFIGCAAVADYRIAEVAENKIKKSAEQMQLALVRNPDILASVASHANRPFTVGFAAETNDVEQYARGKLSRKKLDMIAANDVSNSDIGFNSDANALSVFWSDGSQELPAVDKDTLAKQLLTLIANKIKN